MATLQKDSNLDFSFQTKMKIGKQLEKEWKKNIVKSFQIIKIHKDIKEIKNQNKNMKKVGIKEIEKKIEERRRK